MAAFCFFYLNIDIYYYKKYLTMITLNTKPIEDKYYIKNDIVYKIQSNTEWDNSCPETVINGAESADTLPYIKVTFSGIPETEVTYYFDSLIELGNIYSAATTTGENSGYTSCFLRATNCEGGDGLQFYFNYYMALCEEQIAKVILTYFNLDYKYFYSNRGRFELPDWVWLDKGYGITSNENIPNDELKQIDFTEEYFNKLKEEALTNKIMDDAESLVKKYNYTKQPIITINWE